MAEIDQIKIGQEIDNEERAIAARLFKTRTSLGINRFELANFIRIDEEELINYENAVEAIPASLLAQISTAMGVSIEFFFSDNDIESYADNMDRSFYIEQNQTPALTN